MRRLLRSPKTKNPLKAVLSQGVRFGGAKEDRTPDLYNAIVALSQLSYGPEICVAGRRVKPAGGRIR